MLGRLTSLLGGDYNQKQLKKIKFIYVQFCDFIIYVRFCDLIIYVRFCDLIIYVRFCDFIIYGVLSGWAK